MFFQFNCAARKRWPCHSRSAQVSLEFTFIVMLLLLLTILVFMAANVKLADFKRQKDIFMLKDVASTVRNEIQVAYASDPGYVRSFDLVQTLDGVAYSISVNNGSVLVSTDDQSVEIAILPVVGNISTGTNIIRKVNHGVLLN